MQRAVCDKVREELHLQCVNQSSATVFSILIFDIYMKAEFGSFSSTLPCYVIKKFQEIKFRDVVKQRSKTLFPIDVYPEATFDLLIPIQKCNNKG